MEEGSHGGDHQLNCHQHQVMEEGSHGRLWTSSFLLPGAEILEGLESCQYVFIAEWHLFDHASFVAWQRRKGTMLGTAMDLWRWHLLNGVKVIDDRTGLAKIWVYTGYSKWHYDPSTMEFTEIYY